MKLNIILSKLLLIALFSPALLAAPSFLTLDKKQTKRNSSKILVAHQAITHNLSMEELRFAILEATISNFNIKWVLEDEGPGFMTFRWDYRADAILTRIEFNESLIQMKYENAFGDFVCQNNIDGICYKNDSDYYLYMKRLRLSLEMAINK